MTVELFDQSQGSGDSIRDGISGLLYPSVWHQATNSLDLFTVHRSQSK